MNSVVPMRPAASFVDSELSSLQDNENIEMSAIDRTLLIVISIDLSPNEIITRMMLII